MTVATEATDGFLRFANTAQQYDYDLQVKCCSNCV